ncbi:hypothetical protein [Marinitoga lauensis]|nr:hypothetical protein [Marinitoga lauensis]
MNEIKDKILKELKEMVNEVKNVQEFQILKSKFWVKRVKYLI